MIRDRNIVCVASNWFEHPTSKHHVMRALSEHNHVLWINYHASRRPTLSRSDSRMIVRRLRAALAPPRRVSASIDILSPLLLPLPESRAARFVNARLVARQVNAALRRLPKRPLQLWFFTPDAPELIDRLPAEKVVYYCVDDFAAFSGFNSELITRLERRTISRSDVVFATSRPLYERCWDQHANTHQVSHGVDFQHFASTAHIPAEQVPADLRSIRRPVFGYIGLISDYVDLELLASAAREQPTWSFVLIGSARCDTQAVSGLPNIHLLGPRPYEQLPFYCRGLDVGLIPFRMNQLTHAVNPIKLREYLAAGLPVVSSPMPAVLRYAPAVRTARTPAEFIDACTAALSIAHNEPADRRRELVRQEGWQPLVEHLSRIVMNEMCSRLDELPAPAARESDPTGSRTARVAQPSPSSTR